MLQGRRFRVCTVLPILVAALVLAAAPAARAQSETSVAVRNVEVDVSAASAAEARDLAVAEAQRSAFAELYRMLAGTEASTPELADEELNRLVRDFEIQQEKTSATRYLGLLTVRFHADRVRDLLLGSGVPFADIPTRPILVLPIYDSAAGPILWEDRTAWRDAWENSLPAPGLLSYVVPPGDLPDIADIGAEEAMAGDAAALARIAERYGASDVLVTRMRPLGTADDPTAGAEVSLTRHTGGGRVVSEFAQVPGAGLDDGVEVLAERAVDAVTARMDEIWREENRIAGGTSSRLLAYVPLAGAADWDRTRRLLEEVSLVERVDLRSLSRQRARVELLYRGDLERLRTSLADHGLTLAEGAPDQVTGIPDNSGVAGSGWVLRRADAP